MDQTKLPILSAIEKYMADSVIRFHMPGHKGNDKIGSQLERFLGENIFRADVTNIPEMDDLHQPYGILKEAQILAAEAFGADKSYFLINGSSCGLQSLVMACCNPGDKILVPRNIHRSILSGIILSGTIPVFYLPEYYSDFDIPGCVKPKTIEQTLRINPSIKAVLVVNPTYHGITSDIEEIAKIVHHNNIPLLVDEAHGPHLRFHEKLPPSSIDLGADAVVHGTHKMLSSLTQASMLHVKGERIPRGKLEATLRLMQSTSTSYILLASLDAARQHIVRCGNKQIDETLNACRYLRQELNSISGLKTFGSEAIGSSAIYGLDLSKVTISVKDLGVPGVWIEKNLRSQYNIQVEMSDLFNILLLITFGNNSSDIECFLSAIKNILRKCYCMSRPKMFKVAERDMIPQIPELVITPREAFFSKVKTVLLDESAGAISAEIISCYPPGIPALTPGEKITKDIIEYLSLMKKFGVHFQGCQDDKLQYINVVA